jgi:hypothetical protein
MCVCVCVTPEGMKRRRKKKEEKGKMLRARGQNNFFFFLLRIHLFVRSFVRPSLIFFSRVLPL